MKFRCNREELANVVGACSRALERSIVNGITCTLQGDELIVKSTGYDMVITANLAVEGLQDGRIIVAGPLFADLVKMLDGDTVTVEADEVQATIASDTNALVLNLVQDLGPIALDVEFSEPIKIKSDQFAFALKRVGQMVAKDGFRETGLQGVLLEPTESGVRLVGSDGVRLGLQDLEGVVLGDAVATAGIILPGKASSEIDKLVKAEDLGDLFVRLSENKVEFRIGKYTLAARLIAGEYRNYRPILNMGETVSAIFDKTPVLSTLQRVNRLARESKTFCKVAFTITKTTMRVSASLKGVGKIDDAFPVLQTEGIAEEETISFVPNNLVEGLLSFTGNEIEMRFKQQNGSPCFFKDTTDQGYLYIQTSIKGQ